MKSLKYFENLALQMKRAGFGMKYDDCVLLLMKEYRKSHKIPWKEYKFVYDSWFNKYHGRL